MKKTLVVLIAALFLLATPLLAIAYGGGQQKHNAQGQQKHNAHQYNNGWSQHQSHRHHDQCDHRATYQRDRWAERQHRNAVPVRHAHYQREQNHHRPVYASGPAIIVGFPRVIFHIGW